MFDFVESNPFIHEFKIKTKGSIFLDFMQTIVLALAFSLFIYLVFLIPSQVDGPSMLPNFEHRQLLFADRTVQWLGGSFIGETLGYDYKAGDVVIFKLGEANLIKRVIATEGDLVRIENGQVYVNGKQIDDSFIPIGAQTLVPNGSTATLETGVAQRVPEGRYFLLGDNREVSKDSRFADIGFVPREDLRGRVFLRYWPVEKFGLIKAKELGAGEQQG